jgi:hypothetical protein
MGLTTDPNDPDLGHGPDLGEVPQNKKYLVLSEEELAKGFIRPVRTTYVHKGRLFDKGIEMLEEPYVSDHNGKTYVAIAAVLLNEDGSRKGGAYLTQEELDQHRKTGGYVGGCGVETVMGLKLAQTWARDINFYGATYCCGCNKHIGVHEFLWSDDGEMLGS